MQNQPVPIHVLTLETLCAELVSGRAVALDDDGSVFRLPNPDTRSLFEWYRQNRVKWPQRNTEKDVEALVDQLDTAPPELPKVGTADAQTQPRILHLKSMRAHRFGGLHHYGTPDELPPEFHFDFEKPLTLIEGENGAGKTSILSAISWCLTGHVFRSQRKPETADMPVALTTEKHAGTDEEDAPEHDMSCITPVPPDEVLDALDDHDQELRLDTWVELTFEDHEGNDLPPIRRTLGRTRAGKINDPEPDLSPLGMDPISYRVGTLFPDMIRYIDVGAPSDLGKAVGALTGFQPLEDLAEHARKSKAKLDKDLVDDRQSEIDDLDESFLRSRASLLELLSEHPGIDPDVDVADISPEATSDDGLKELAKHFDDLEAQTFEDCKSILGDAFDPNDPVAREGVRTDVGPALGCLAAEVIEGLPSIARLRALVDLSLDDISRAEELVHDLLDQAAELADLEKQPALAARQRLYARIASWLRDLPGFRESVENCPVCNSILAGKLDPETDEPISASIERHLLEDSSHLAETAATWEKGAVAALKSGLAKCLGDELTKDLLERPAELMAAGWGDEVFNHEAFKGSLAPLHAAGKALCTRLLAGVPQFEEPAEVDIPKCFGDDEGGLRQAARRLGRAIAFARWAQDEAATCRTACSSIVGDVAASRATPPPADLAPEDWSLSERLVALDRSVQTASPLRRALEHVVAMTKTLGQRQEKEHLIELYGRAANAIDPLLKLGALVEKLVAAQMSKLEADTLKWRHDLYSPAFRGAPEVDRAGVATDGSLQFDAAVGGTRASALHISNASDLRATLLAFLIAFWQHLLKTRGGLSILLLDDPQELLDPHNLGRMAAAVPLLADRDHGGRIIVTTNSAAFRRRVAQEANRSLGADQVDQRRIHTRNTERSCICLGCLSERIDQKREAFEANENDAEFAQDYINSLRIYLEEQLLDLFDEAALGVPIKPTLANLVNAVRTRTNRRAKAFADPVFERLVADTALMAGSPFMELMNQSHHGKKDEITFRQVWDVREVCKRVRKTVDAAHEAYQGWLRRDPVEPSGPRPAVPDATELPLLSVPLIENLAAFTADHSPGQPELSEDLFDIQSLGNCALYVVATNNFGFAGHQNCRAIVDLSDEFVENGRLVIALHESRTYARRLIRDNDDPRMVVLSSEAEDPTERPPALILPADEVSLFKVVGVLFDDQPVHPRPSEEAQWVARCDLFGKVKCAYRVTGDSALPLALSGQIVLGGRVLTPADLEEHCGKLVAVDTSDGSALKRVGAAIPDLPIRQFESVGGLGESWLVRTEDVEGPGQDLPLMNGARLVLGVVYASA